MVSKVNVQLGDIQETLLIPLWSRAIELQQPDPILRDYKSAEILQTLDYDFDKFSGASSSQVGCCLRGLVFDNWVKSYLDNSPEGPVIELGAGLNTRFERVDNGRVQWFDLDLPDSTELRKRFFEETERRFFLAASALSLDWIDSVKSVASDPCFFVAEGVLMYLSEQQVQELFDNLARYFPGCWLAFDSMAPLMARRRHETVKHTSAQFDWAIANIREIETWSPDYQLQDVCTFADLPQQIPLEHYRRFSKLNRALFSLPFLRNIYRLALVKLG